MKNLILFFSLFTIHTASAQDAWRKIGNIGPETGQNHYTSIAIDSNNVLYVAYSELSFGDPSASNGTTVKKFDGTNWITLGARAYTGTSSVGGTKIAVNQQGTPYVIYSINPVVTNSPYFNSLRLDQFNGSNWDNVRVVIGTMHVNNALTIDNNNSPLFAYNPSSGSSFNMNVATTGSTASLNQSLIGVYADFAIDKDNNIYMVYRENDGFACVQRFNGTSWEFVGPSAGFSTGACTATRIALDQHGVPFVVYRDLIRETIDVKKFNGTSWELVGTAGFPGKVEYPDIAIDRNNVVYVSYTDFMGGVQTHPNYMGVTVQKFNGTSWELLGQRSFTPNRSITNNRQLIVGKNNVLYLAADVATSAGMKAEAYYYGPATYPPILPVSLINFHIKSTPGGIEANWSTASESNNDHFILERSPDGKNFAAVGRIKGAGNSNSRINYSHTDKTPLPDRSYYRLKQVDFNDNHSYSDIRSVVTRGNKQVQILPSNTAGAYTINISNPTKGMRIQVYEMKGRLLYNTTSISKSNTISLNNYVKGVYLIKVMDGSQTISTQKVIR